MARKKSSQLTEVTPISPHFGGSVDTSELKQSLLSSTSIPDVLIVASGKGGVGKTTVAVTAIDLCDLHGREVIVVQLDDQDRLERVIGRPVTTIPTETLRAARRDPTAGVRAFRPLMENMERAKAIGATLIFDIGATQVAPFLSFAELAELDEDLREFGIRCRVLVPALAEPESLKQAARTIDALAGTLPSAEIAFVENQRDGVFADLVAGSDAHHILDTQLRPAASGLPWLIMPAVDGRSWAHFERHHCRPLDVIKMDVQTIMQLTGLPRAEAKIVRGDVAAWVEAMQDALLPILCLESGHGE